MDFPNHQRASTVLQRQLANLKLVSRLLGHELHSQSNAKSITLSRESIHEIQTTLDLFIEEVTRASSGTNSSTSTTSVQSVSRS